MSATISINGHEATIDAGEWSCDDPQTLDLLRALDLPEYLPDAANAYTAAEKLGGTVISAEPEEPEIDEDGRQCIY